jgi:hypothetical protein
LASFLQLFVHFLGIINAGFMLYSILPKGSKIMIRKHSRPFSFSVISSHYYLIDEFLGQVDDACHSLRVCFAVIIERIVDDLERLPHLYESILSPAGPIN